MKLKIIVLITLISFQFYGQVITNDELVLDYLDEYVEEANKRGKEVDLNRIKYILITDSSQEISDLAVTNREKGIIVLSNNTKLDKLILKITLYRELSYIMGVPYDSSLIMRRIKPKNFSFAPFIQKDIMEIEMDKVLELL